MSALLQRFWSLADTLLYCPCCSTWHFYIILVPYGEKKSFFKMAPCVLFSAKKTLLHYMPDYSYYCESFFLYKDPNISTNHDEIFGFLVSMYYYITLPPLLLPYIGKDSQYTVCPIKDWTIPYFTSFHKKGEVDIFF